MDKRFRYAGKHVHDLTVEGITVRVWDVRSPDHREAIEATLRPLAKAGFVHPFVALMPDYHPGEGVLIGSVIPTREVILPSVIGGDLGCGMTALPLPIRGDSLAAVLPALDAALRASIPVGTADNTVVTPRVRDNRLWQQDFRAPLLPNRQRRKLLRQFASLGGGNHFLEIQQDEGAQVWIMLHSGSRYLGVSVRDYYVAQGQQHNGVDPRLYRRIPYLPATSPLAEDYLHDLQLAVDFARESRREMMIRALEAFCAVVPELRGRSAHEFQAEICDVTHNYVARERHFDEDLFVHRKGAIHVSAGELGLVPGSMGTCSYIVEGRGNRFGLDSCSHGAGRAMSRANATRKISDQEFLDSVAGVFHQADSRLKDEAPAAYKNIRQVMRAQRDLVRIRHELQPLLSIKGAC
ncbi:MAG: RtcB family protein [Planctomycetota bacterium]|nr:RtcB family protein [Planctomycetota bacterium]